MPHPKGITTSIVALLLVVPVSYCQILENLTIDMRLKTISEQIINRYFEDTLCVITESNNSPHLNVSLSMISIMKVDDIELLTEALDVGCSSFLIQIADPESWITSTLLLAYRKSLQRIDRKILIIPDNNNIVSLSNWTQFLTNDKLTYFSQLLVVSYNVADENILDLVTNKFNGENDWNTILKIDQWTDGKFLKGVNLFPDKVHDLKGKHVTLACFNYPSYIILQPWKEEIHDPTVGDVLSVRGQDYRMVEGTELRLALEWSRIYNATWVILDTWLGEWGEIFENGTGNGVLGAVYENRADIGITALYQWWNEWMDLGFTSPSSRTGVTCLVPKPNPLPMWLTPVLPFNGPMWTAVGLVYLLSSFACSCFSRVLLRMTAIIEKRNGQVTLGADGRRIDTQLSTCRPPFWEISDSLTRMMALMVSQGPGVAAKWQHPVSNGFLLTLMLMLLLITSGYSSGLSSILTVPRFEPPIETLPDLAHSKFHWAATHDAWVFSLRLATDANTKTVYNKFQVMTADQLRHEGIEGKMAFSLERLSGGSFAIQDYITEQAIKKLRLMHDDLYYEYVVMVTRKSGPYTESLSKLILRLQNSGILLHWEGDVVRKFLSSRVQTAVSSSQVVENQVIKLGEEHILGTVFVLAFGLGASLCVFISELIFDAIHHRRKKPNM